MREGFTRTGRLLLRRSELNRQRRAARRSRQKHARSIAWSSIGALALTVVLVALTVQVFALDSGGGAEGSAIVVDFGDVEGSSVSVRFNVDKPASGEEVPFAIHFRVTDPSFRRGTATVYVDRAMWDRIVECRPFNPGVPLGAPEVVDGEDVPAGVSGLVGISNDRDAEEGTSYVRFSVPLDAANVPSEGVAGSVYCDVDGDYLWRRRDTHVIFETPMVGAAWTGDAGDAGPSGGAVRYEDHLRGASKKSVVRTTDSFYYVRGGTTDEMTVGARETSWTTTIGAVSGAAMDPPYGGSYSYPESTVFGSDSLQAWRDLALVGIGALIAGIAALLAGVAGSVRKSRPQHPRHRRRKV